MCGGLEQKQADYKEAIQDEAVKTFADHLMKKGITGEELYNRVMQYTLALEMSHGIAKVFINRESLRERDRPLYDFIVTQIAKQVEPYFAEIQTYQDARVLVNSLIDATRIKQANQTIINHGGEELFELLESMLGSGWALGQEQLKTGDKVVDHLIETVLKGDAEGISADTILTNATALLTAAALDNADGETLQEKMGSISHQLSEALDNALLHYKRYTDLHMTAIGEVDDHNRDIYQKAATKMLAEGFLSIFFTPEERQSPLYQYVLNQVVNNVPGEMVFNSYDILRQQKPIPGASNNFEKMLLNIALHGFDKEVDEKEKFPQTLKDLFVRSLIPELKDMKKVKAEDDSAFYDILMGGIRFAGGGLTSRVPNAFADSNFFRNGLVKITVVMMDSISRSPTENEKEMFGDLDTFADLLTNKLLLLMYPEGADSIPLDKSIRLEVWKKQREYLREIVGKQLEMLDQTNEVERNKLILEQLKKYDKDSTGMSKKAKILPLLKQMSKKTGKQDEVPAELIKGEIASIASKMIIDRMEYEISRKVPGWLKLGGLTKILFAPLIHIAETILFFKLQWLIMESLDKTAGKEGQIMMCKVIWTAVNLFDPQETEVKDPEKQSIQKTLTTFFNELR